MMQIAPVKPRFGELFKLSYQPATPETFDLRYQGPDISGYHPTQDLYTSLIETLAKEGISATHDSLSLDSDSNEALLVDGNREKSATLQKHLWDTICKPALEKVRQNTPPLTKDRDAYLQAFLQFQRARKTTFTQADETLTVRYHQLDTPPGYVRQFAVSNMDELVQKVKKIIGF